MWGNWLASYLVGRALGGWFFVIGGVVFAAVIVAGIVIGNAHP